MQHPTQRGELLCNSVGYTVASFQDILSWLCNSSGLGHSCLLWNWHVLISRKSLGHCWPPRLCPNFKIKEKVQSWNSNLRYRQEVGPKRKFLLHAFYRGSLCIVVVLFLRLFVFLSWHHSDQMSERVWSLKSHSLCQNSKVAVSHSVSHWPRSGIELPGQLNIARVRNCPEVTI